MAETQVLDGFGAGDAPRMRETKSSEQLTMLDVVATFDGSAAAGAFVPAVIIESDADHVVGAFPLQDTLQVGDSATVTFAPFLSGGAGGIKANTLNVGGWLNFRATSNLNPDTGGVTFEVEKSQFGVYVDPVTGDSIHLEAPFFYMNAHGGIFRFELSSLFDVSADAFTVLSDQIALQASGAAPNGTTIDGNLDVDLRAGNSITVFGPLGNPIARIDADGSWHGLAAVGAITWDL